MISGSIQKTLNRCNMAAATTMFLLIALSHTNTANAKDPTDCAMRLIAGKGTKDQICTATYVKNVSNDLNYLVTAYHCVCDKTDFYLTFNEKESPLEELRSTGEVRFVSIPKLDLCVFECTESLKKLLAKWNRRPVLVSNEEAKKGAYVSAVGNPTVEIVNHKSRPFNYASGATLADYAKFRDRIGDKYAEPAARTTNIVLLESAGV